MEYCLADARAKGKSGVCLLGAEKQKAWLSDQAFAKKFGFQTVDTAPNGYELLALSFDGTKPRFAPVSYTHLDVYKRQEKSGGKSWRWQSHASLRSKVQATRRMPPKMCIRDR